MPITAEQARNIATAAIRRAARSIGVQQIRWALIDAMTARTDENLDAVWDAVQAATVTITWPDSDGPQ